MLHADVPKSFIMEKSPKHIEYVVEEKSPNFGSIIDTSFIRPIDEILNIIETRPIYSDTKGELIYKLNIMKMNVNLIIMKQTKAKEDVKNLILYPVIRSIQLVKHKPFGELQINLLKCELKSLRSTFE